MRRLLLVWLLLAPACSADGDDAAAKRPVQDSAIIPEGWPKATCDALDPSRCAFPWPSDLYLAPAEASATGLALTFADDSLPATRQGVRLRPALFTGLDGYGLGVPAMFDVGPLALDGLPDEWGGLAASVDVASSKSLLLRMTEDGLVPVPHWVEPDRSGIAGTVATHHILRPAVILEPASEYVVVLRNLEAPNGAPIAASPGFAALRDRVPTDDPGIASRRDAYEAIFDRLAKLGVARQELTLAWRFTTGSEQGLHGRLDGALAAARAKMPAGGAWALRGVTTYARNADEVPVGSGMPVNAFVRHHVKATLTVPAVVSPAAPGEVFTLNVGDDGKVYTDGSFTVDVLVQVPHTAVDPDAGPVEVTIYGHGMFGDEWEVVADHLEMYSELARTVLIGVPMTGMSAADGDTIRAAIPDLNGFTALSDGLHQGLVQHELAAVSARQGGLSAFLAGIDPGIAVTHDEVRYFGASQGGIFGATLLATSNVLDRGVLAVPGQNYSTMLSRSVNFEPFFLLLGVVYSDPTDVALIVASVQLLWDRTDPVSYYGRLLDPAAGKDALLLVSKGDKQVAVVTTEIAGRTHAGRLPALGPWGNRSPWGLATASFPHTGSGMILFDFGNPWPTDRGNLPPSDDLPDPHSRIGEVAAVAGTMINFLKTGVIADPCGGDGCTPE
jgi:hypothetical protein